MTSSLRNTVLYIILVRVYDILTMCDGILTIQYDIHRPPGCDPEWTVSGAPRGQPPNPERLIAA